MSETNETPTYGGQAVIEGVMMRGPHAFSVAVRNPEGEVIRHTEPLTSAVYTSRWAKLPFLRGLSLLWDALGLGTKALMFSAEIAAVEEEEEAESADKTEETKQDVEETPPEAVFSQPMMVGTVLLSLSLSIGLFFLLPAFLADMSQRWLGYDSYLISNFIEGGVRLFLVIAYIWGIGRLQDIQRVFQYHGAEHKTIHAYEAGAELTPESVQRFPLEHPRCGTGFLLTVVVISILIFSLFPDMNLAVRLLSRVLLIPVVAGIAYEYVRFTAKNQDKAWVRWLTKPNLALQKLTTREPDLDMLAVAIIAFNEVVNFQPETAVDAPALEEATPILLD